MDDQEVFEASRSIVAAIDSGRDDEARLQLIQVLSKYPREKSVYAELLNHLIRITGLYPYMQPESSRWEDRLVAEMFRPGGDSDGLPILHREQSLLLKRLLDGDSVAVSAPTSFGKSFVVDALIQLNKPKNVVIVVPTVALTDETRRRIRKRFAREYKIITTVDEELGDRNILIFPQERVFGYLGKLPELDLLIIDEFYKASGGYDKDRSGTLQVAMLELSSIAKQRYFLAPNISTLKETLFVEGMDFLKLDFHTVFLDVVELWGQIGGDTEAKANLLLEILDHSASKTLVYAGTYSGIDQVATFLLSSIAPEPTSLLIDFSAWLAANYSPTWQVTNLVQRRIGVHNGRLHRSLSQIQIRLFEESEGLNCLISTSSIIEGVNTSAGNVVVWSNKNGRMRLDDFTYKNIIGRSGRMFKHFIGNVFVLEKPPADTQNHLAIDLDTDVLGTFDTGIVDGRLTKEQAAALKMNEATLFDAIGVNSYGDLDEDVELTSHSVQDTAKIAGELRSNSAEWNGVAYLNSDDPEEWDRILYLLLKLRPGIWNTRYSSFVKFVKLLSQNWSLSLPQLLDRIGEIDLGIDQFFQLERSVSFNLSSLVADVNAIMKMLGMQAVDLSPFVVKLSYAFLPRLVYQLEEYGLPRSLSRKINRSGVVDLEDDGKTLHSVLAEFSSIGLEGVINETEDLMRFDLYILEYFFDGL